MPYRLCNGGLRCADPTAHVTSPDRLQPGLDLRAARLQKWRQRQFFAKRFHRLVGGKAGAVGGDLEQDAVRLAEIKTTKIKPVDLAGVADAELRSAGASRHDIARRSACETRRDARRRRPAAPPANPYSRSRAVRPPDRPRPSQTREPAPRHPAPHSLRTRRMFIAPVSTCSVGLRSCTLSTIGPRPRI